MKGASHSRRSATHQTKQHALVAHRKHTKEKRRERKDTQKESGCLEVTTDGEVCAPLVAAQAAAIVVQTHRDTGGKAQQRPARGRIEAAT